MRRRNSLRCPGYDYSRVGAYFVTINTRDRFRWFRGRTLHAIAERCWRAIPEHHPYVELDAWVVMPDHMHGIIVLHPMPFDDPCEPTRAGRSSSQQSAASPHRGTLGVVIRSFKAAVTMEARRAGYGEFAWQRQYYDRIVRSQQALERTRMYIMNNPRAAGLDDQGFCARFGP